MQQTILIVDDEAGIVSLLQDYFEMNGYRTMVARDGEEAIRKAGQRPDLILLDIGMPKMDGLAVCEAIRAHVACPILFLTARVEDRDKVAGFVSGGDDYITKPFSMEELGARVQAHLRREARRAGNTEVRFADDLAIDYAAHTVHVAGEPVPLAKKEFDILAFLSQHGGQVFDKERIYERVWGYDAEGDSAVVAEHVKRIRAKLKAAGAKEHIETVWGVGYKWV